MRAGRRHGHVGCARRLPNLSRATESSGIRAGDDELRAHVVVAADGVNSFLCQHAGIRSKEPMRHLALGVKSVIALPREVIEARFTLTGDEGVAYSIVGDCTQGLGGGGFLYTNLDSVSVGVVVRLDELAAISPRRRRTSTIGSYPIPRSNRS